MFDTIEDTRMAVELEVISERIARLEERGIARDITLAEVRAGQAELATLVRSYIDRAKGGVEVARAIWLVGAAMTGGLAWIGSKIIP